MQVVAKEDSCSKLEQGSNKLRIPRLEVADQTSDRELGKSNFFRPSRNSSRQYSNYKPDQRGWFDRSNKLGFQNKQSKAHVVSKVLIYPMHGPCSQ